MTNEDLVSQEQIRELERRLNGFRDAEEVSLKIYIDIRFDAVKEQFSSVLSKLEDMEQETNRRFLAEQEATKRALEANDRRLDALNELRGMLADAQAYFVQKAECIMVRTKFDEDMKRVEDTSKSLELTRASMEGKASKAQAIWAAILGSAGLLLGAIGLIVALCVH